MNTNQSSTHLESDSTSSSKNTVSQTSRLDKPLPSLPLEATVALAQDEERLHAARTTSPSFKRKLSIDSHAPDSDGDAAVDKPDVSRQTAKKSRTSFIQASEESKATAFSDGAAPPSSGPTGLTGHTSSATPHADQETSSVNKDTTPSTNSLPASSTVPSTAPTNVGSHDSSDNNNSEGDSDRDDSGYSPDRSSLHSTGYHLHNWRPFGTFDADDNPSHGLCNNPGHVQEPARYDYWCCECPLRVCNSCREQIDNSGHGCPWWL
ncbi:hypothetical protein LTR56_013457 [Elasticomyces elasticus]|nr:hypothetical protein LTR56_013457 [Elasticomyces elasticus]KAK3652283.1 hypothetical protein LTR22_011785 [Elasticomyces elasticus]KAK4910126.1 hypothetical protein LTR49_021172 [Elasticomyces elasticus]KAK5753917.1 hypothetical protein LTS12_016009 [Elasticomyces elasticus]